MPTATKGKVTFEDGLVGARLRMRRNELGLSQSDIAKALGITFQQIQKYENGTNRISAGRLTAAAAALGVPVTYFFGGDHSLEGREEMALLRPPGAMDLLRCYAKIRSGEAREALLQLARSLAKEPPTAT